MHNPGLFRHLAIATYDALLLLAVLFLATAIVLPFNSGEAFTANQYLFPCYLLTISFIFYGWFWTHGGQTLGMRAWKVKVLTFNHQPISWSQAFIRFMLAFISWAIFGLGYLWKIVDKQNYTWHDRLSKTALFFE